MTRAAEWDARWWSPIINAEHLAMRERVGIVDLSRVRDLRRDRPRRLRLSRAPVRQQGRRRRRAGRSTRRSSSGRRDPRRPDHHAAGPRSVPGGDRRRDGHARYEAVHRPRSPDDGSAQLHDATNQWTTIGLWGPRARDVLQSDHRRRRQPRRLPVPDERRPSTSTASGPWPRGSATSASSAGRSTSRSSRACGSGTPSGRRAEPRHGGRRDRRRTPSPPGSRRATEPTAPSSSSTSTWSRPAWPGRRSRTPTSSARRPISRQRAEPAGRDPVHADRRRPDLGDRHQALHARPRADPDPRRASGWSTPRAAART